MSDSAQLAKAIKLFETGEQDQAGVLLAEMVRANPDDREAWGWLARCVRTERQREWCQEQIDRISHKQPAPTAGPSANASYWIPVDEYESPYPAKQFWWRQYQRPILLASLLGVIVLTFVIIFSIVPGLKASALLPVKNAYSTGGLPEPHQPASGAVVQFSSSRLSSQNAAYLPALMTSLHTPTAAVSEILTDSRAQAAIADERPNPKKWKAWPVLPFVSEYARQLWRQGVNEGNNPHAFSILGDCHSQPDVLFGRFADSVLWDTADYKPFKKTLKYFRSSWDRSFVTVVNGMSVASALNPTWARSAACKSGETPLACELRLNNPSILIVSLGTNWGTRSPDEFEQYLRQILDLAIKEKVLPIIATKGDPAGAYNPLNERMVAVAYEYDLPLWNFWEAIQDLPDHGLKPWDRNGVYLSVAAWQVKRDTGLQALNQVREVVTAGE